MSLVGYCRLLSEYNRWMNEKLYDCAGRLDGEVLQRNLGAYFKSVIGTLNHIMVADLIWLQRFARHCARYAALREVVELPGPPGLDHQLSADLNALWVARQALDDAIYRWTGELREADLDDFVEYTDSSGAGHRNPLGQLVLHFFNHQTHHRGQITTLLQQNGIDVGVTDLAHLIRQRSQAATARP